MYERDRTTKGQPDVDRDVWMQFYRAHGARIWRWAARFMGGSAQEVADVVQETFLAAAQCAHRFDVRRGNEWGWLWGIARRQMALHFRRRGRRGSETPLEDVPSIIPLPQEQAAQREVSILVRRALMAMDDEAAFLLAGKYFDGMTTEALAAALGISVHAAESKLVRARQAFRDCYAARPANTQAGERS
jgi:RNA polymerase sigma-70 factor, ECF subfamily